MKRALLIGALLAAPAHAIIGMPWTPFSVAGVARRTVRRTAAVGAAAAYGTAAAVGTAAAAGAALAPPPVYGAPPMYALPPGCVVGVPCGAGVVYRPVYQGPNVVYVPR